MKLKLELERHEIKALLRGTDHVQRVEGSALEEARRKLAEVTLEDDDSVVGRILAGFRTGVEKAQARRMAPRWEWLKPAIAAIDRTVKSDPAYVHNADAIGAYVRDTFDALGLSVRDPETLYVALVTASTVVELASNGHGRGKVSADTLEAVAKIAQSFAASVIPYLPDEAKP